MKFLQIKGSFELGETYRYKFRKIERQVLGCFGVIYEHNSFEYVYRQYTPEYDPQPPSIIRYHPKKKKDETSIAYLLTAERTHQFHR